MEPADVTMEDVPTQDLEAVDAFLAADHAENAALANVVKRWKNAFDRRRDDPWKMLFNISRHSRGLEDKSVLPVALQTALFTTEGTTRSPLQSPAHLLALAQRGLSQLLLHGYDRDVVLTENITRSLDRWITTKNSMSTDAIDRFRDDLRDALDMIIAGTPEDDDPQGSLEYNARLLPVHERQFLPPSLANALYVPDRLQMLPRRIPYEPHRIIQGVEEKHARLLLAAFLPHDPKNPIMKHISDPKEYRTRLDASFRQASAGNAVTLFRDYLEVYNSLYRPLSDYGRTIAIVQSSGTGKSKLMRDLALYVPSVTICFRESDDAAYGWPPRDKSAQDFLLMQHTAWSEGPEVRAAAFLGALFEDVADVVQASPNTSPQTLIKQAFDLNDLDNPENSGRHQRFMKIANRARMLLKTLPPSSHRPTNDDDINWYAALYGFLCAPHATRMVAALAGRSQSRYFVVGLDECTQLNSGTRMSLIALQRIIKAADSFTLPNGMSIWYTLLDTNPTIASLVPPKSKAPSARLTESLAPVRPWYYLGFNQMAINRKRSATPKQSTLVEWLQYFGRPLWSTVSPYIVLNLALLKLFRSEHGMASQNPDHVLAAFTHRIGLELVPSESSLASESVRSHLRFATGLYDRKILVTAAPAEPILALAACETLTDNKITKYSTAVSTLLEHFVFTNQSHVTRGMHGELLARLILIIARDIATCYPSYDADSKKDLPPGESFFINLDEPKRVKTITLAQFLKKLLGGALPAGINQLESTYINFTHFATLNRTFAGEADTSILRAAWDRGAAIQCAHLQPMIDLVIVTYSAPLDEEWDETKLGTFCIQVRLRDKAASSSALEELIGPSVNGQRPDNEVVMLMDLGTESEYASSNATVYCKHERVTRPKSSQWQGYDVDFEKPRWIIGVRGCNASYPLLKHFPAISTGLSHTLAVESVKFGKVSDQMESQFECGIEFQPRRQYQEDSSKSDSGESDGSISDK